MFGLKLRNLILALALASIAVLVAATPSAIDESSEGKFDLFGRAVHTGQYAGAPCSTSADCYSRNCAPTYAGGPQTCQLQPVGGPCFESGNCFTKNCNTANGTCITPSKLNGFCNPNTDDYTCFTSASDKSLQCDPQAFKCKLRAGYKCKRTSDCATGTPCTNGKCALPKLAPNQPCNTGDQCISGSCSFPQVCHEDDGQYEYCAQINEYSTYGICDTYPLGHTCANPGDCKLGQCKGGVCSNSTVGDQCAEPYQCTNGQTCSGGKCTVLASRSQPPRSPCSADDQCISGACATYFYEDSYGLWHDNVIPSRKRQLNEKRQQTPFCGPLSNGQGPCNGYADCDRGLCKNSTCQAGKSGDRCIISYECDGALICSTQGVCYTPTSSLPAQEPCKTDSQCDSNNCSGRNGVYRPAFPRMETDDGDPAGEVRPYDFVCAAASNFGGKCSTSSNCGQGVCKSGTCQGLALGSTCSSSSACLSGACVKGKCAISSAYAACSSNSQCFSNQCVDKNTGDCTTFYDGSCPARYCLAVPKGGTCRLDADCSAQFGTSCNSTTQKCVYKYDTN